ncbi:MAG: hypothetical protein HY088_06075 [Ignavibacteriales bacterium]|nr:hypothetical protein [Ignavibacteriales bacterium]
MKQLLNHEVSELLSLYVDGELDAEKVKFVEQLAAQNSEVANELNELRFLKRLLTSKQPVPEKLGFWTRLSVELDKRSREQDNLLPFPKKLIPLMSALGAVAMVVVAIVLYQNRSSLFQYAGKQSERVQQAYENNILKASLMPWFSNLDKNQVLQFALFGTLPLDAKAETALRVDESAEKGYRIDVGRKQAKANPRVTVADLYKQINPTQAQLLVIDSLLNRVMLAGITASLEPHQRDRLERFLQTGNAPYKVAASNALPEKAERIFREIHRMPQVKTFILVSPDSAAYSHIDVDLETIRIRVRQVEFQRHDIEAQMDVLMRRFADREMSPVHQLPAPRENMRVEAHREGDFFSIRVESSSDETLSAPRMMWVKPRIRISGSEKGRGFNYRFYQDDSTFRVEMQGDSITIVKMGKMNPLHTMEHYTLDSIFRDPNMRMRVGIHAMRLDSLMDAVRRGETDINTVRKQIRKMEIEERTRRKKIE